MTSPPSLKGLKVVDFTRILSGPLCTTLLSDLGAEVVKIERPATGDDTRSWGPPTRSGDATYYLSVNRGKKSAAFDLTSPDDLAAVRALVLDADVVVENFRDGVMARFGLDYTSLREEHPGLVYCSIPAYAEGGAGKAGYDLLMQASTGLMSVTGVTEPTKVGVAILDVVTGLYAAVGILSAVMTKRETGQGQRVVVGLFDASVSALVNQSAGYLLGGTVPGLSGNEHPSIVPYQLFHASDVPFVLAAGNDKLFMAVAEIIGRPDLLEDGRYETNAGRVEWRQELVADLQVAFKERTATHWVEGFEAAGIPAAKVRSLDEVFASPEGRSTLVEVPDDRRGPLQYVRNPIRMSHTPIVEPSSPPPEVGEHTQEVLDRLAGAGVPQQESERSTT